MSDIGRDPVSSTVGESVAAVAVLGAFIKLLPPLAAAAAIVWYGFQIWESPIGKRWRARWRRVFVERKPLTVEDRMAFLLTGIGGAGVALVLLAVYRLVGV